MSKPLATQLEEFIDHLGLRHFRGAELTPYWSRTRRGGANTCPPRALWPNIVPTLVVLDEARERLGKSIVLTSTYRSPAYNRGVGGAQFSMHLQFNAIDFQCRGRSPRECAKLTVSVPTSTCPIRPGSGN